MLSTKRKNLIKNHPEVAADLQKKLATWRNQQKRPDFVGNYGREAQWFEHYFNINE